MYTQEQYDELPEWMQKELVKDGDVYKHGGFLKVKQTADNLDSKYKEITAKLADVEKAEADRILQAEQRAYEKAKKEGNVDEIEKRYKQQLEDAQRRASETEKQFKERMAKLADKQRRALAQELAAKYAIEDGREAFKRLVITMIDVDAENDSVTFLDDDGSATSLDATGFEAELKNKPLFQRLLKSDIVTQGGGNAKGSNGGSANKRPEDYTEQERVALFRSNPTLFNQLFKRA